MNPGAARPVWPEPIACVAVLLPSVADCPYSYQYEVGEPFGVTLPVTTAVEFVGETVVSVTTLGFPADEAGDGFCVSSIVVVGVVVACGPTGAAFILRKTYPPPTITI